VTKVAHATTKKNKTAGGKALRLMHEEIYGKKRASFAAPPVELSRLNKKEQKDLS
jgi:hypothetical protein